MIVLREELEPRVEGEASGYMDWGSTGWPTMKRRSVVGVGEKMNKRFQIKAIGKGLPTAEISKANKVTWYDWSVRELAARPYEVNRPPASQTGPSIWYSTF